MASEFLNCSELAIIKEKIETILSKYESPELRELLDYIMENSK